LKVEKTVYVFTDNTVKLFEDEDEYLRYTSRFFLELAFSYPQQLNSYWNSTYKPTLVSFTLLGGYNYSPWYGFLGQIDYINYTNKNNADGSVDIQTNVIIPQIGVFANYRFTNFYPYIDATLGYAFTSMNVTSDIINTNKNSWDFYYSTGVGVRIFVWRQLYIDPAFHFNQILYQTEASTSLNYRLGAGLYFQ
jgi:hypothetical protein